ncbi:hypothetical protein VTL71DRAFT_12062 [Oculimacula yallundae]|uniref:BTB domain-containing protein n=1 Tax=Oculimacula yallundae TaxID=86028 RepID=A0ABR4CS64_9HELO
MASKAEAGTQTGSPAETSRVDKTSSSVNSGVTFIGDDLNNELVTIYVGPKRKEFLLHKNLLCKSSDYFDKAFNSNFQEAEKGTMFLPEDNPEAFALFVNWLYRSTIPAGNAQSHVFRLADLYILADKICLVDLKDEVMDIIQDIAFKYKLDDVELVPLMHKLWKSSMPYHGLTKFCNLAIVDSIMDNARYLNDEAKDQLITDTDMKTLWEISKNNYQAFHDAINRVQESLKASEGGSWDCRKRMADDGLHRCYFHCHADNLDCTEDNPVSHEPYFVVDINEKGH